MTKQIDKNSSRFGNRGVDIDLDGNVDHDFFDDDNDVIQKPKRVEVPNKAQSSKKEEKVSPRESSKKESSTKKSSSKHEKMVQSKNESNQNKPQEQEKKDKGKKDLERREKEKREKERREREIRDAERRERELEIERWEREREKEKEQEERERRSEIPVIVSRYKPRKPPAGYRDPHEIYKKVLPKKVKDEKRQEIKALMNCIAFEPIDIINSSDVVRSKGKSVIEEIDNSLSSDTTSDITDVTPRSSSSGCSSMSKQSMNADKNDEKEIPGAKKQKSTSKRSKSENRGKAELEYKTREIIEKSVGDYTTQDVKEVNKLKLDNHKKSKMVSEVNGNTNDEFDEMKYLQDAFDDFDIDEQASSFASSIISGLSEERRLKCGRKNMTFTNDQLREIERVNLILLKKIMGHRKPRAQTHSQPPVHRKSSTAINRAKMEKKIEQENMILLKRLQAAKGTTGTMSRKTTPSPALY